MKVYIVTSWVAYEGSEVLGAYATAEAASKAHPEAVLDQECSTCGRDFYLCGCEGTDAEREENSRRLASSNRKTHGERISWWQVEG